MGIPPINNHQIHLLIYVKSAHSGAMVYAVSPFFILYYYSTRAILCQDFFDFFLLTMVFDFSVTVDDT